MFLYLNSTPMKSSFLDWEFYKLQRTGRERERERGRERKGERERERVSGQSMNNTERMKKIGQKDMGGHENNNKWWKKRMMKEEYLGRKFGTKDQCTTNQKKSQQNQKSGKIKRILNNEETIKKHWKKQKRERTCKRYLEHHSGWRTWAWDKWQLCFRKEREKERIRVFFSVLFAGKGE